MMNRIALTCLRLGALSLGLSAPLAHAGKIAFKNATGDGPVAMLNSESILFADAYRAKIVKEGLAAGGNSLAWSKIKLATHSPTVARMEYTFTINNRLYTRVYHARSGPAMDVVLSRIDLSAPGESSKSGSSGTESEGSRPYDITEEDIAKDFAERKYYPVDTELNVRVPNLPTENSEIEAILVNHGGDAELKIFRQIESDIATKTVPRGGKLKGYVSKAVCESCSAASRSMAEQFDIDGEIYQLVEPELNTPPSRDLSIRQSNEASTRLKGLRKDYATNHFKRNAVTAPGEMSWTGTEAVEQLERIEAEAERAILAEPCGN